MLLALVQHHTLHGKKTVGCLPKFRLVCIQSLGFSKNKDVMAPYTCLKSGLFACDKTNWTANDCLHCGLSLALVGLCVTCYARA